MDQMYYRRNRRSSSRNRKKKSSKGVSFYLFPFLGVLLVFLFSQIFSKFGDSLNNSNIDSLENALVVKAVTGNVTSTFNQVSTSLNINDPILSTSNITVPFDSAIVLESKNGSEFRVDQSSNFIYNFESNDNLDTLNLSFKSGKVWVNSKTNLEQILLGSSYLDIQTQNVVLTYKSNLPEDLSIFSGQALAIIKDLDTGNEIDKFRVESNTSLLLDNSSYSDFLVNKAPLIKSKTNSSVYLSNWYKWNTFYDNNNVSISFDDIFEEDSQIAFKDLQNQIQNTNKLQKKEVQIQSIDKSTTPYFTYPKANEVITDKRIKLLGKVPPDTAKVMIISFEEDEPLKYILKEYESNTEDFVYYAFSDPQRGNLFPGVNKFEVVAIDVNGNESPSSSIEFVFRDPDKKISTENLTAEDELSEHKNSSQTQDESESVNNSGLDLPVVSSVNELPYESGFDLKTNRAYIVGSVPEGASKVTINGFDLTMFKEGQTRFHYILSEGFNNLKNGENILNISYEKNGLKSPSLKVVINYTSN
ncbi:hypothetical protein CL656_04260 [bacterium]|nr:hypothetical protein [bacterium]|tara:strand:+ start:8438 stop:10027 length:1590 start_codon:yes stop_codon:yes gene_type:complete